MPLDGTYYKSSVTQVLIDSRQKVQDGWCQNVLRWHGAVCMIEAVVQAAKSDYGGYIRAEELIRDAIRDLGYPFSLIVSFNDDPSRTKDEVLGVYDRAIELSYCCVDVRDYAGL